MDNYEPFQPFDMGPKDGDVESGDMEKTDDIDFDEAMKASGLCPIYVDENTDFSKLPNPFRPLHPALKACACGFVGNKYELEKHLLDDGGESAEVWFKKHGEIPYYD